MGKKDNSKSTKKVFHDTYPIEITNMNEKEIEQVIKLYDQIYNKANPNKKPLKLE